MATALTSLLTRFTDKCNRVLAGGIVKTYEPNSLTPKVSYQDPESTIPNLPEVVLDETGRAKIYLLGDYRVQVYSNDGVLIEDNLLVEQALVQRDFDNLSTDIQQQVDEAKQAFENTGGLISAPTLTALQAITPEFDYQLARVDDTGNEYRWNPALTTTVKWEPTGRNFLSESKAYTDDEISRSSVEIQESAENFTNEAIKALPIILLDHPDYSVCIQDKNGQLALGLLLKKDGTPHELMIDSIYRGMIDHIAETVADKIGAMGYSLQESKDGSFFIVDKNKQMSCIGMNNDGTPHSHMIDSISKALRNSGFSSVPDKVKSSYQNQEIKAVSGPNIICVGDSMTYGAGGNGYPYPMRLKQMLSAIGSTAQVFNFGVGGETSAGITARHGANPFIVNPFTIPADTTPVAITLRAVNGVQMIPLYQGNGHGDGNGNGAPLTRYFDGEIAGVKGRISLVQPSAVGNVYTPAPDDYYTFTRTTAGSSVSVTRPSPFYLDYAKQHWGDIHIIWIGQNNGTDQDRAIADVKAIINKMDVLEKRYLVLSKPVSSTESTTKAERDAVDAKFFAEFGRRFIPIRQYMIEYGLQDAGITATTQDNIDISNGQVPTSLRTDSVHFTAAAYQIVAQQVFNQMNELGWI